jgi:hypothetical protein
MPITGSDIVGRAITKANDVDQTYWGAAESLKWVNDAQRAVVSELPKAGATMAQPMLQAGSRQTLAGLSLARGIEVVDLVCNVVGAARSTPIHRTSRAWLDDNLPNWHADTSGPVEYWTFDERDPSAFYVWPNNGGKVELIYAAPPADLAAIGDPIGLNDIYAEAMQNYVLFCYFSKDITKLKSAQYAQQYYSLFLACLGKRGQSVDLTSAAGKAKEVGQ